MRVLLVGKGAPERGGIAAFLAGLEAGLQDLGHDVDLLNLTRAAAHPAGRFSSFNVSRTLSDVRAVWRRAGDYDVVHVHSAFVPTVTMIRAWLLCLAARSRGVPVVLHVHGGRLYGWMRGGHRTWLARLTLQGITLVMTASQGLVQRLAPFHPSVEFVPNGVDADRFRPDGHVTTVPVVIYVGVLSPRKGVIDLMTASRDLLERGIDHRLVLVGGRPDEGDEAEREVRAAVPPHAELVGAIPYEEIPAHMASADIFCLPSWYEAMPLSILEAMASGLPVVATTVGQIPDVVDSEVGELVPPQNPGELGDALERLLASPDRREAAGAAARHRVVSDFSLEAAVTTIETAYRSFTDPAD